MTDDRADEGTSACPPATRTIANVNRSGAKTEINANTSGWDRLMADGRVNEGTSACVAWPPATRTIADTNRSGANTEINANTSRWDGLMTDDRADEGTSALPACTSGRESLQCIPTKAPVRLPHSLRYLRISGRELKQCTILETNTNTSWKMSP